jgi:hypothetical protein
MLPFYPDPNFQVAEFTQHARNVSVHRHFRLLIAA